MKIIYITTSDPASQGDYQEVSMLNGLREVLGDDCIDYPRKKIMYGEYDESPKNELHGWGFSLLTHPIKDVVSRDLEECDYVIYGVTNAYGVQDLPEINRLARKGVYYLDGHDHERITKKPCFKRELYQQEENVYPTGFGIPEHRIRDINNLMRQQPCQRTAPPYALFGPQILGIDARQLYCFTDEEEYYRDMGRSFFGLTCKKGGWDSLRHYEILATGAVLLFRDYDKKPPLCSPQNLPCYSYSSIEELQKIMNNLVTKHGITNEYYDMQAKQREWLLKYGTTKARALALLEQLR